MNEQNFLFIIGLTDDTDSGGAVISHFHNLDHHDSTIK